MEAIETKIVIYLKLQVIKTNFNCLSLSVDHIHYINKIYTKHNLETLLLFSTFDIIDVYVHKIIVNQPLGAASWLSPEESSP